VSPGATQTGASKAASDAGWPRQYTDGTARLVLYEPQVDTWTDFRRLTARLAVSLATSKTAHPTLGVLSIAADTEVNLDTRSVALENLSMARVDYPSASDDAQLEVWQTLTRQLLPSFPTRVALDRLLAYMDESHVKARQTNVQLTPPRIFVSPQPAVLVIIDGEPIPLDVERTKLEKIVNTNWDLFFDQEGDRYYLRNDKAWLSARELTGAWSPVAKLPKDFSRLPADDSYKEVRDAAAKPHKLAIVPLVLVTDKPSEMIVLSGEPALSPIKGTQLMWVTNTECDLFRYTPTAEYYFLTSGRWFRASELRSDGWLAATTTLPEDFKKIPADHPRAHVLAAVPGTRQAEEAILNATIPRMATIDRKSARAEVKYVGDPKFELIGNSGVSYAINTPNDVFQFGNRYYLCLDGVWFAAGEAAGPWTVTDDVPKEIYAIPADSAKYHVTYVNVYDSDPDTITYGYTAGYYGTYIGYGVAMWGTGYYYPPYYAYGYYPYPVYWPCAYYTYGASAWYNPATGTYGRGSAVYGPYGGYARAAAYNPATGAYSWGRSAWGAYGSAASGGFYNPSTGTWGGGYRASNGYQSWGRSVVGKGDQWARTGSYSNSRGTVAGIETSSGGKAVAARGSQGQGFAGKTAAGDFYAGKDGNVYKRDQSGQWYKNNGGAWESVNRPSAAGEANRAGDFRSARPGGSEAAAATRESIQNGLNHDASARRWGDYNAQRTRSTPGGGNWSSGGFVGRGSSGWATRSPGFGGRRR
jgi:hypothetical protein